MAEKNQKKGRSGWKKEEFTRIEKCKSDWKKKVNILINYTLPMTTRYGRLKRSRREERIKTRVEVI